MACRHNYIELAIYLIEQEPDINAQNKVRSQWLPRGCNTSTSYNNGSSSSDDSKYELIILNGHFKKCKMKNGLRSSFASVHLFVIVNIKFVLQSIIKCVCSWDILHLL